MTTEPSRLRKIAWAIAPILLSRYDHWQQKRQRERQRAQRILDQAANPEAYAPPEREPRTLETTWLRANSRAAAQPWRAYANELDAERRALQHRITRHQGVTLAVDNFLKRRDRDGF
jgi:hypothetical protein